MRRERSEVLETGGERNLNVVQQTVGERDLRLDVAISRVIVLTDQTVADGEIAAFADAGGRSAGRWTSFRECLP